MRRHYFYCYNDLLLLISNYQVTCFSFQFHLKFHLLLKALFTLWDPCLQVLLGYSKILHIIPTIQYIPYYPKILKIIHQLHGIAKTLSSYLSWFGSFTSFCRLSSSQDQNGQKLEGKVFSASFSEDLFFPICLSNNLIFLIWFLKIVSSSSNYFDGSIVLPWATPSNGFAMRS